MIAPNVGVAQFGRTIAPQSQHLTGLRPGRHFNCHVAIHHGRLQRRSQQGVHVRNGFFAVNFGPLATEFGVRLDLEKDVQVPRRSTIRTGVAFAPDAQLVAIFDAGRDGHLDLFCFRNQSLSAARAAIFFNCLSRPPTGRTGLLRLKVAQRRTGDLGHHAAAVAGIARGHLGSRCHAAAVARGARFEVSNAHLFFAAKAGRLELNFQIEPQIVAHARSAARRSTAAGAAAHATAAAAKKAIKDIPQIHFLSKTAGSATAKRTARSGIGRRRRTQPLFAKHVVLLFQLRIGQHFVSAIDFLKLFGGIFARIGVGMVLFGQFAVRALYFLGIGRTGNAQDLVKIPIRRAHVQASVGRCGGS
mmetsp:Transcript_6665/g.17126  ORF Transcript_6665/g.17126 Transcript_6665/m.17126 type:complete len:359 (+) Transcript_6665:312-1388(+)